MTYTLDELNNILLKMQSINYNRYQHYTAADILIELLANEQIADYWEVEWKAFLQNICDTSANCNYVAIYGCHLDEFLKPIISRAEKVRILTFFRDHANKVLFDDTYYQEDTLRFRSYCAQLISQEIQQSKNDRYYGEIAEMPQLNLVEISLAKPLPSLSREYQIIADNMPTYPQDLKLFHPSIIVTIADEFAKYFRKQALVHSRTKEKSDQPLMSIKQYKNPIRDRLIQAANRYLYFDEGPIYQTMWAICLMLRMIPKPNWWEEHCAENILNYLYLTKFFKYSKIEMDTAIQKIRQLTEQTIPFDDVPVPIAKNVVPQPQPTHTKDMQLVEVAAYYLQKTNQEQRPIIFTQSLTIDRNDAPITSFDNCQIH